MIDYFIQPYVEGKRCTIFISKTANVVSIKAQTGGKRCKLPTPIKKELKASYEGSKYNGFSIVLDGSLVVDKSNKTNLILFDILLKDEYDGKLQSRNYETRHENLTARFIKQRSKLIKPVFSAELDDKNLDFFISVFVNTDTISSVMFRKNKPYKADDEFSVIHLWTELTGSVVGYVKDTAVKKEFDENQNVKSETQYDYLKTVVVSYEGKDIDIDLVNYSEKDRVELLSKAKDLLGTECKFKRWDLQEKHGYLLTDLKIV